MKAMVSLLLMKLGKCTALSTSMTTAIMKKMMVKCTS